MQPRRASALVAVALLLSLARVAGAQTPTARRMVQLDYRLEFIEAGCPSERDLRAMVSVQLGYDPFEASARERARASIARRGERLVGEVALFDEAGRTLGLRNLDAASGSCNALAQTLALDLAIAIEPAVLLRAVAVPSGDAAPEPTPVQSTSAEPAAVSAAPVLRETPPEPTHAIRPSQWSLQLGALGETGLMPSIAAGVSLVGEARWHNTSAALEAELFPYSSVPAAGGRIRSILTRGGLRGCQYLGPFGFCARLDGGVLHAGAQGIVNAQHGSLPAASAGPVLVAGFRPAGNFTLGLGAALDVALLRNTLFINGVQQWRAPPFAFAASASVGWIFP